MKKSVDYQKTQKRDFIINTVDKKSTVFIIKTKYKVIKSMSRKGNCYDNSIMETFFGRIEM